MLGQAHSKGVGQSDTTTPSGIRDAKYPTKQLVLNTLGAGIPMALGFPMVLRFGQNGGHFVQKHLNSDKMAAILFRFPMVWFWNGRDQSFQNRTIGNSKFKIYGNSMC